MHTSLIVGVMTGMAVVCVGGAVLLNLFRKRAPVEARLTAMVGKQAKKSGVDSTLVDIVGNLGKKVSAGKHSLSRGEKLAQAGYHNANAASILIGSQILLFIFGAAGTAFLVLQFPIPASICILAIGFGGGLLFFVPNLIVGSARKKRTLEIQRRLPDAIDLLEICSSAGIGLDAAWNFVADEMRTVSPLVADEMALTSLEMNLGTPRSDAMRNMARRTGVEDLTSLVTVLVQSERFGTSIIQALRVFAGSLRESMSQRSQEAAEKIAGKMMFPMVVFIFPSVMLLLATPAIMTIVASLKQN